MSDRLKVTSSNESVNKNSLSQKRGISRHDKYREQEAKFERKWLENPDQYNPFLKIIDRVRIERILQMIPLTTLSEKKVADIGCGFGILAEKICQAGAFCDACDVASNALKQLPDHPHLCRKKTSLPETHLEDNAYDFVLCSDTIAELDPKDYRLAVAELCRILKPEGQVLVSTPLDMYAEDALDRFIKLMETEFTITNSQLSYHSFYLKIIHLLELPEAYWKAHKETKYRTKQLAKRTSLSKAWFALNSTIPLTWFWGTFQWITILLKKTIFERKATLLFCESLCKFLKDLRGVSHIAVICKRKPLLVPGEMRQPVRPDRAPFIREKKWE